MSERTSEKTRTRGEGLLELWELCRKLRAAGGCPWDREQTPASLTPYVVEETYEILESVAQGDLRATAEELGDLLALVIFLAEMVEEQGGLGLDDLARAASEKLRRRHPNLFAGAGDSRGKGEELTATDQHRRWQELKQQEKGSRSLLGQIPADLPALIAAYRTQEKASTVGFDWPRVEEVVAKVEEELAEVRAEMARGRDGEETLRQEIGDLLFAAANLSRFLRIDPERELRAAVVRFRQRFLFIEESLRARGSSPSDSTLEEMDRLWEEAKRREHRP